MKQFSRKTATQLKYYVYLLVNPQTEEIFYVGRGLGKKRPFSHLDIERHSDKSDKDKKISELRNLSIEPRIDILRHGLEDSQTAREVEAAVIDAIGLHKLTNVNSGEKSSKRGRLSAIQIESRLGGVPLDVGEIEHPVILFHRKNACPEDRLYDETRQFWKLSQSNIEKRNQHGELKYQYAFAMRGNFVLEVYKILAWFEAGTTVSSRTYLGETDKRLWEFIGSPASVTIRKKYRNRSLMRNGKPLHAIQGGFRYLE